MKVWTQVYIRTSSHSHQIFIKTQDLKLPVCEKITMAKIETCVYLIVTLYVTARVLFFAL